MRVSYIRVSTEEQNTARQEDMMQKLDVEKVFLEKISGKNMDRPQLKAMLDFVREGDILIVESYSRLSRSTQDLLNIVEQLGKKGVQFISLKENIDTTSPQGKLQMTIFAAFAEFERECTLQRTREGVAIAKAQGKYKGKPPKPLPGNWIEVMKMLESGIITTSRAMELTGFKNATFFRNLKKYKEAKV